MLRVLRAERQKMKHSFAGMLPVFAPIFASVLAYLLTSGLSGRVSSYLAVSVWNWWYTMLLPGVIAIVSYFNMAKEKKTGFYNLKSLAVPMQSLVFGKIAYISLMILLANGVLVGMTALFGLFADMIIPLKSVLLGALVLTVTVLWQVPLCLLFSVRFGMVSGMLLSMVLNIVFSVVLSASRFWWCLPYSIATRLMCPILGIQPNNLLVPEGSPLWNTNVILPGIALSLAWFVVLSGILWTWMEKMEAK